MTQAPAADDARHPLEDVLITDALAGRPSRPPDHAGEARALGALARTLATNPRGLLQEVVETAMALCRADSAGVSILEPGGEHGIFRCRAAAGPFAANLHGTMPREASPCGDVVHRDAVLLFDRPARHFPALRGVEPAAHESLLAPWAIGGAPAGTLWVIAHAPERQFDAEDARLLASVARFAAAAWQTVHALEAAEAAEAARGELGERVEARTRALAEAGAALQASEARLRLALDLAELGTWAWDLATGAGHLDARGGEIVGLPPGDVASVAEAQRASIHPDDLARTEAVVAAGIAGGADFDLAYRAVRPDGSVRHVASRARALADAAGRPVRLVGTNRDVTAEHEAEVRLRASEARYRMIVEGARDYAIVTTDPAGRIESWSPGAEAVFGWPAAEAIGQELAVTFVPEDRAAGVPEAERAAARAAGAAPDVRWHLRRDGRRVFLEGSTRALRDEAGALCGFLKIGEDVTARVAGESFQQEMSAHLAAWNGALSARAAEREHLLEALSASEARFRALVDNVQDHGIFLLDADGVITQWTLGAERVKGYTAAEAVGQPVALFYTPGDVAAGVPERELAEAAATGRGEWEGWRVRKGGARFWADEVATAVRDGAGRLVGFTKISRDLTERRLAEQQAALGRAAAERDALRRRLAAAEEAERRRLARELHDEAGQHLAGLALGLKGLAAVAPPGSEVDRRVAALRALAETLARELHAVAVRLRPRALDDFGLEVALAAAAEEWARQTGVAVDVRIAAQGERLPTAVESAVYRVVQEALTNVARHSGATRASVLVDRHDGTVRVVVEDDGRGFDAAAVAAAAPRPGGGLGLAGIRERAALLGGSADVESAPGTGTTVFVRIPIDGAAADDPMAEPTREPAARTGRRSGSGAV